MPSVLDLVRHYQHGIEKYPQDEQRVLRYIDKLFRLNVTVAHLQETGVGRTVNALRKEPGDIGKAARALVYKWKLMVAAEESDQEGDHESKASEHNRNGKDPDMGKGKPTQHQPNIRQIPNITPTLKPQPEDHRQTNGDNGGTKRKYPQTEEEERVVKKQRSTHSSDDDHHNVKVKVEKSESDSQDSSSSQSDSESDSGGDVNNHGHTITDIKTEPVDNTLSDDVKSSKHSHHTRDDHKDKKKSRESSSEKHSKHSSDSKRSEKKTASHSSKDSSAKDIESNSHKYNKDKIIKTEVTSPAEDKDKKYKKEKSSKHNSEKHSSNSQKSDGASEKVLDKNGGKSEKHSSSHRTEKDKRKSSEMETNVKHKSRESSSSKEHKAKEGSSSKEHRSKDSSGSSKDKSSSSKEKSKDKTSSSKDKSRSHSDRSDKKSSSDKSKSDSRSKEKEEKSSEKKSSHKSRSSSHKSSSSKSKESIPKIKVQDTGDSDDDGGIGCESGASFAEALGMISPAKSKKKSTPAKDFLQPGSASSSSNDLSPAALLAPTTKLAPLPALEISALPEISPNYKPRPPPKCLPHFDEDAMSAVISSKNQRTKVYSGNKVMGKIPTLYELCVNVLQEHIDALEYTGGVPYEILKPVIDRATPQQLFMLEHYNAYLIEDTDHLWQKHVEKHFRNKKREEMETYRDMYLRCQEEQEYKLKSLTENIKLTQEAKKAPIKQTKMAYVDSVVKPPRNIARKQALHGTKFAATASPAARVASLATAPNVMRGSVRPSPSAPIAPAGFNRPKKAPLMQKALQFMRGRKR